MNNKQDGKFNGSTLLMNGDEVIAKLTDANNINHDNIQKESEGWSRFIGETVDFNMSLDDNIGTLQMTREQAYIIYLHLKEIFE